MWKAPQRPRHEVSQSFNDGIVNIFTVTDKAAPGYQPVADLRPKISLRYEERRLGLQRAYLAQQNQVRVARVIRVQRAGDISSQDLAITEDGQRYRIDLVQTVEGVYPPSVDLTLALLEQRGAEVRGL